MLLGILVGKWDWKTLIGKGFGGLSKSEERC